MDLEFFNRAVKFCEEIDILNRLLNKIGSVESETRNNYFLKFRNYLGPSQFRRIASSPHTHTHFSTRINTYTHILFMLTHIPSWLTPARELRILRLWLYLAISIDVISSCLYLFLPAGTGEYFGGIATPSATFWCSTAATGDAVSALWCATALHKHTAEGYREASRGLLLFSIIHLGAFARGHYMIEPHPGGGATYILGILFGLLFGYWFGFHRTLAIDPIAPSIAAPLSSLSDHERVQSEILSSPQ
jgi:hypothetical protein